MRTTNKGDAPSPMQAQVLAFLQQRCKQGLPPTFAEIAEHVWPEMNYHSLARSACKQLEAKGYLTLTPMISRGIQLTKEGRTWTDPSHAPS